MVRTRSSGQDRTRPNCIKMRHLVDIRCDLEHTIRARLSSFTL